MNYKEKYEMALERAKCLYSQHEVEWTDKDIEYIFPELKKSEDERLRKELVNYFTEGREFLSLCSFGRDKILAWLEKQESLTTDIEKQGKEDVLWCIKQAKKYAKDENEMGTCWFAEQWLEKQENKPVNDTDEDIVKAVKDTSILDMVEPKFNVGNWIVFNGFVLHVDEIVDGYYRTTSIGGIPNSYDWAIDDAARLWTIADAKCGDVLYSPCCKLLFIFKNNKECYVGNNLNYHAESIVINSPICVPTDSIPTTKEQRELLFQKMHEAGYEWDVDKKEPIKIESQQAEIQKWSEEDEDNLTDTCVAIRKFYHRNNGAQDLIDWLKSLKERETWKPSDKQIRALRWVLNNIPYNKHKEEISGLLEQIKDL